jgi:hypothetical protein
MKKAIVRAMVLIPILLLMRFIWNTVNIGQYVPPGLKVLFDAQHRWYTLGALLTVSVCYIVIIFLLAENNWMATKWPRPGAFKAKQKGEDITAIYDGDARRWFFLNPLQYLSMWFARIIMYGIPGISKILEMDWPTRTLDIDGDKVKVKARVVIKLTTFPKKFQLAMETETETNNPGILVKYVHNFLFEITDLRSFIKVARNIPAWDEKLLAILTSALKDYSRKNDLDTLKKEESTRENYENIFFNHNKELEQEFHVKLVTIEQADFTPLGEIVKSLAAEAEQKAANKVTVAKAEGERDASAIKVDTAENEKRVRQKQAEGEGAFAEKLGPYYPHYLHADALKNTDLDVYVEGGGNNNRPPVSFTLPGGKKDRPDKKTEKKKDEKKSDEATTAVVENNT